VNCPERHVSKMMYRIQRNFKLSLTQSFTVLLLLILFCLSLSLEFLLLVLCSTRRSYTKYSFGLTHPVRSCFPRPPRHHKAVFSVRCRRSWGRSTSTRSSAAVRTMPQSRRRARETEDHLRTIWFAVITSWRDMKKIRTLAFTVSSFRTMFHQVLCYVQLFISWIHSAILRCLCRLLSHTFFGLVYVQTAIL